MEDLSHWDGTFEFTAAEAAALIVGLDPADPAADLYKTAPILKHLREGHRIARAFLTAIPVTPEQFGLLRAHPSWAAGLMSVLFDSYPMLYKEPWPGNPERPFELPRRFAGPDGDFDQQRFSRAEIHRWLRVMRLSSKYHFIDARAIELTAVPEDQQPAAVGRIVRVSGRRRLAIAPAIEAAQSLCEDKLDTASVWAELQVLAKSEKPPPPLVDATGLGLKYRDNGVVNNFTRSQLDNHLGKKRRALRDAEDRSKPP